MCVPSYFVWQAFLARGCFEGIPGKVSPFFQLVAKAAVCHTPRLIEAMPNLASAAKCLLLKTFDPVLDFVLDPRQNLAIDVCRQPADRLACPSQRSANGTLFFSKVLGQ